MGLGQRRLNNSVPVPSRRRDRSRSFSRPFKPAWRRRNTQRIGPPLYGSDATTIGWVAPLDDRVVSVRNICCWQTGENNRLRSSPSAWRSALESIIQIINALRATNTNRMQSDENCCEDAAGPDESRGRDPTWSRSSRRALGGRIGSALQSIPSIVLHADAGAGHRISLSEVPIGRCRQFPPCVNATGS